MSYCISYISIVCLNNKFKQKKNHWSIKMEKKEKYVDKIVIQKCLCHLQWHCWRIFFLFLHSLILSSAIPYWIWFIIWLSLALNTKNILFFFHYTIRFYSRRQHSFKLFHFLCLVYCRNIFWYWSGVLFILKIFKSSYLKITLYFFMSTWFQNLTIIGEKHNYEVANIFFTEIFRLVNWVWVSSFYFLY